MQICKKLITATAKKMIAPAMNTAMYDNLLTQANIKTLKEIGFKEIDPRVALLACGDLGRGALATVADIVSAVQANLD